MGWLQDRGPSPGDEAGFSEEGVLSPRIDFLLLFGLTTLVALSLLVVL